MQKDKSATILEAQWMEQEIPRIEQEVAQFRAKEQELLTAPLATVTQAYTDRYRAERRRAYYFYRRRRSVTPTRYGYRERQVETGWFVLLSRILIVAAAALAVYVAYHNHQIGETQRGIIWASVFLVIALGLAFAPALADQLWERRARKTAERAAAQARESEPFRQEKDERRTELRQVRTRLQESEERLRFARVRLGELRRELTSSNHGEEAEE
jgi:hypothetical protein